MIFLAQGFRYTRGGYEQADESNDCLNQTCGAPPLSSRRSWIDFAYSNDSVWPKVGPTLIFIGYVLYLHDRYGMASK